MHQHSDSEIIPAGRDISRTRMQMPVPALQASQDDLANIDSRLAKVLISPAVSVAGFPPPRIWRRQPAVKSKLNHTTANWISEKSSACADDQIIVEELDEWSRAFMCIDN